MHAHTLCGFRKYAYLLHGGPVEIPWRGGGGGGLEDQKS